MAVKIRLRRMGAKKAPFYRVEIDADRAEDWIAKGAQPTDTVKGLLKKEGIL